MPVAPTTPAVRPFRALRHLLPWVLTLAAVTCTQDQLEPSKGGVGYFSFRPVYGLAGGAQLSQFGIVADSIHVRLTRPVNQLVLDTTVFFPPDSTQLRLALPVQIQQSPESLLALVEISAGGTVVFRDSVDIEVKDGPPGSTPPPTVTFTYVGPGTNIGTLQLVPGDTTIVLKDTLFFSALAFDSSAAPVASFYVGWKTTDTTVARINANGRLIAPAARGSVGVIGFTPTGIADTTIVTFAPVPVTIYADSGGGQTGLVGDSLAALFVARVMGADSLGISGVPVKFQAVVGGGAVRDTLVITDAQGRARTRGVLGTTAVTNNYSATALGTALTPAVFLAGANAATPTAIAIVSGNAQVDTAGDVLPAPFVVHVTDAFGNAVAGAKVVFTDLNGGSAPDTLLTLGTGDASAPFTLRTTVGIDSVQASLTGTSAFVTFTATAIAGGPASVAVDSGNTQSATVATAFAESLVARVTDLHGNAVPGAKVAWIVTTGSGTLSTDTTLSGADGRARVGITAGVTAGALHVQGSAAGAASTAQFALTVTPGAPAAFVMVSGDTQSALPGGILAQPLVVAVRDAHGNGIAGQAVAFAVTAGLGTVDSATATTNASGLANSGRWTLGPVAGTNLVRATVGVLPADTLTFTATGLPAGTTKQWLGTVDTLWSTAGNWSPSGAPGAADNVFIPASATNQPVVGFTGSVGGLSVEAGATVKVATGVSLNTTGNLQIAGAATGPGTITVNGSGTTLAGTFSGPVLWIAGTVTQNGPLSSVGDVTVNAGTFTPAGFPLAAAGNFTVGGTGKLVMTNAADSVDVTGTFAANSSASGAGSLTAGVLVLRGGFTSLASDNFSASGTHRTRFAGSTAQVIDIATPGLGATIFRDVEFADAAGVSLTANGFAASGLTAVTAGTVTGAGSAAQIGAGGLQATYADWKVSNTFFQAAPSVYPDSLSGNVAVLAPWTLTKSFTVDSALVISGGGVLNAGGHRLTVTDLSQGNRLVMQSPADTVDVKDALVVTSAVSGAGDLTDGLLILRNAFSQSGASASFRPSGAHRTLVTSAGAAALAFQSAASGFNHVTFNAAGGTAIAGNLSVSGNVLAQAGVVSSPDTLILTGDTLTRGPGAVWALAATDVVTHLPTLPDSVSGSLILRDTVSLSAPLFVLTDLYVDHAAATLLPNHHPIWVDGALTVRNGGLLRMTAGDTVHVTGDATFSGRATNGALTGGFLDLAGGFAATDSGFVADPAHVTRLGGVLAQNLFFAVPTPGDGHFGSLDLANVAAGITLGSDVRVEGTLTKAAGTPATVAGPGHALIVNGDLAVDGVTFDGARFVVRDSDNVATFDHATFTNQDPTATQFSFTGPGGSDTLKFHNVDFQTTPTTGAYVAVADSAVNGLGTRVAFYQSTPLNGSAHQLLDAASGDSARVLWSRLVWEVEPDTGVSGGFFTPAPSVAAVDPDSVRILGYTGTVTLSFAVDPSGGTAVLSGNSRAAVSGLATFDSLSVSVANAGYVFQASSPELGTSAPSRTSLVLVPLPPGTTTAFTNGGGDGSWDTPANWTAGVPDSADNVFVYPNLTATVNNPSRANRITVGTGASLVLNNSLTVDSSVAAGNTISGGGTLIAQGSGQLSGQMGDLVVVGGYTVPAGDTLSAQSLNISGVGFLDAGLGDILVADSLTTTGAGHLNLNNAPGRIVVGGHANFAGGATTLTAGTLALRGDLDVAAPGAVAMAPGFNVDVQGTGHLQTITYAGSDSLNGLGSLAMNGDSLAFALNTWVTGNLNINTGLTRIDSTLFTIQAVGGTGAASLVGNTLYIRSALLFPGTYTVGTSVFSGTGMTIPALAAPYDSVYVTGTAQLGGTVDAQVVYAVGGGLLDLGGHRLNVASDFGTGSDGKFAMTSPADSLFVGGSVFAFGGATTGLLTNGLVQVTGNFYQGAVPIGIPVEIVGPPPAGDGYHADTGLVTRFVGGAPLRTIYFANPLSPPGSGLVLAGATSQFGALEILDGTDSITSVVPVAGTTLLGTAQVTGVGTLASAGALTVQPTLLGIDVASLYTGGGLDYQPAPATYNVPETFFFGGPSIPVLPYQWLRVGFTTIPLAGDLTVTQVTVGGQGEGAIDSYGGEIAMNGHAITTTGNFTLTGFGQLAMTAAADSLDVGGNFSAGGGDMAGLLTDGVIVARSNVYVSPNWVDTTFHATGLHRFRMAAPGAADLWVTQGAGNGVQFNRLTVDPGTTVNFNPFSTGALVVADTFAVHGFFLQAAPAKTVIALGELYVGTSVGINVDTLELHQGIDVDLSTFSTQLVRYVGTGQLVDSFVTYHDLEVTGSAALRGLTTVTHDLRVRGPGTLDLAGHRVNVADSLQVADSGLLVMQSAADTADVGVTASFDGRDSDGWLTAGVLRFNYFVQGATTSPNAFRATGSHKSVLLEQNPLDNTDFIQFATPGIAASRFQEFTIDGGGSGFTYLNGGRIVVADSFAIPAGGSGGVYATGTTMTVGGPMVVQTGTIPIQFDTLELSGDIQSPAYSLASRVTRFAGSNQRIPSSQTYNWIEITGSVTLDSIGAADTAQSAVTVTANGHLTLGPSMRLITSGFTTEGNGVLEMTDPNSVLQAVGATFNGGSTAGLLRQGILYLVGSLDQGNATSNSSFAPDSAFTVEFLGAGSRSIGFASAGDAASHLGNVGIPLMNFVSISAAQTVPIWGTLQLDDNTSLTSNTPIEVAQGMTVASVGSSGVTVIAPQLILRKSLAFADPSRTTWNVGTTWFFGSDTMDVPAGLTFNGNVLVQTLARFNGSTTITGNLQIGNGAPAYATWANATVHTGGFQVGDLSQFRMASASDSLFVGQDALFNGGSELGLLTAGYLSLGSNVTQDTANGGSPSAFVSSGTAIDLPVGVPHTIAFATPDSSFFPTLAPSAAGTLQLDLQGRARIAGDLNAYGLILTGDTLLVDSTVTGGPAGAFATLRMLRTGAIYGGTAFSTYAVGTTQFTLPGALLTLPYDTLVVSDTLQGSLSQAVNANYLEVTGPGNPRHAGAHAGWLGLAGGDGFTTVSVAGNVLVSGAGATIHNGLGTLDVSGDLDVTGGGLIVANDPSGFGTSTFVVGGSATFDGASTKDSLTNGLLRITKDFTQGGPDPESFAADSAFITQFMGGGTHQVRFLNPGTAGAGMSHFGELQSDGSVASELALHNSIYLSGRVISIAAPLMFSNVAGAPIELNTAKLDLSHATFNDVTLHWTDPTGAPLGEFQLDSTNFTNFQPTEDQFVVEGTATLLQPAQANDITFSPLAAGGTDPGHYVRVIDTDSPISTTPNIQILTVNSGDPAVYFQAVNGAFLSILPFP